jgi:4-azaleucine resistance transporter AzlC
VKVLSTPIEVSDMKSDLIKGAAANLPVALSVGAYGSVLGTLAAQKGISWSVLMLMNLTVFAGSSQFVMVGMWLPPLPMVEITLAVLVINLRYLLIGASLRPVFRGASLLKKTLIIHLVADENWAVTMAHHRREGATPAFLLGGGLCLLAVWSMGTLTGHLLGTAISSPEALALDFAFFAVFTALAAGMWRGGQDLPAWLTAALVAVATEKFVPGKWYIVTGGLAGAAVALLPFFKRRSP